MRGRSLLELLKSKDSSLQRLALFSVVWKLLSATLRALFFGHFWSTVAVFLVFSYGAFTVYALFKQLWSLICLYEKTVLPVAIVLFFLSTWYLTSDFWEAWGYVVMVCFPFLATVPLFILLWVQRRIEQTAARAFVRSLPEQLQRFGEGLEAYNRRPTPPDVRNSLAIKVVTSSDLQSPSTLTSSPCAICMEGFELGQSFTRLPCQHHYHTSCLNPWLDRASSCPICRRQLAPTDQQ